MKSHVNKKYDNLTLEQLRMLRENLIVSRFQKFSSDAVFSKALVDIVYSEHFLSHLFYLSSKNDSKYDEEPLSLNNAPVGFLVVPCKKYSYAQFRFAVNGNSDLIKNISNSTLFKSNDLFYSFDKLQNYIVFKIYSKFPFIENEELLAQINNEAKKKKQFIEESILEFNSQIDKINFSLKHFSENEFLKEKQKRDLRDYNLKKLNPF